MTTFAICDDKTSTCYIVEAISLKDAKTKFERMGLSGIVYLVRSLTSLETSAGTHFKRAAEIAKEGRESSFPPKVSK